MPEKKFASRAMAPVQILLRGGLQVEGSISVSAETNRFSDAWEEMMRDPRAFIAVTEAETRSAADGAFQQMDAFLLIRKSDIVAVRPVNEQ